MGDLQGHDKLSFFFFWPRASLDLSSCGLNGLFGNLVQKTIVHYKHCAALPTNS